MEKTTTRVAGITECRKHSLAANCLVALAFIFLSVQTGQASNISAVWANDGGDKVTADELRASRHIENLTGNVINRVWDGSGINLFGAHNEVVSFNVVLEAGGASASNVTVQFDTLTGPNGATIHSVPASADAVFTYNNRPIELFFARYLQIKGLSYFGYNKWDERQIPARFRRPANAQGQATDSIGWAARPDHDKFYPDPLVPLELTQPFTIPSGKNQSIWADIYIPKQIPSGVYTGTLSIAESGIVSRLIHVSLTVAPFALPDSPPRAFGHLSNGDIMHRFVSTSYVNWGSPEGRRVQKITDRYYQLFHRHRVALIGENECPIEDHPCDSSLDRLSGDLYKANRGYDGPGAGVPNGVYSIGTYGSWSWGNQGEQVMWNHADAWASWFQQNSPNTDYFLYLEDEPPARDYDQVQQWARWLKEDPGVGHNLTSLATIAPLYAQGSMPDLDIPVYSASIGGCLPTGPCDNVALNKAANDSYRNVGKRKLWAYNDNRPATGSMDTEDDGISPRVLGWSQFKMDIGKWFYWFVNIDRSSDLFQDANTWYGQDHTDFSLGYIGPVSTNGAGLLAYPGTDLYNPSSSYNVDGAFASVRLKNWRRGLQDYDYLQIASRIDGVTANAIVQRVLPKTMWEISAPDPTFYTAGGNFYSSDPDVWEEARSELMALISNHCTAPGGSSDGLCNGILPSSETTANLTFTSSAVGTRMVVSGNGCPAGTYVLPYSFDAPINSSCGIEVVGPSGFVFSNWDDSSLANPRVISVPRANQAYNIVFNNLLPNADDAGGTPLVGLHFVPMTPCRMVDTRNAAGPYGGPALQPGVPREYMASLSGCNIPPNARALALNATVVPLKTLRWLTIWPSDQQQPFVSTLNSFDGRTKANGQIIRTGQNGGIRVFASEDTHVVLDISGYFVDDATALTYHRLTPCRLVDTRAENGLPGRSFVPAQTERSIPVQSANCGVSSSAKAYALNYTAIPRDASLGWMTTWPTGSVRPTASTLNAVSGTITANGAITQAGANGSISVYGSDNFDLVIDVAGYFDLPASGGDLFYATDQCRFADSRNNGKPLSGASRWVVNGSCQVPSTARVLAGNVTVVPQSPLAWLTIWQDGDPRPLASNLNAQDGEITSNYFLTPLNNGAFDLFAISETHVVIDLSGYFAP